MKSTDPTRRRFVTLFGAAGAIALAGCADDPDDDMIDDDDDLIGDDTDDDIDDDVDDDVDDDTDDDVDDDVDDDTDDDVDDDTDDDVDDDTDDDVDDDVDDDEDEDDDEMTLFIHLENEDGEPVSEGVTITVSHDEEGLSHEISEGIEDGTAEQMILETGDYTITVEGDDFDTVEESVTFEEEGEEVEITIVLEGAAGDEEEDDEDEENGDE